MIKHVSVNVNIISAKKIKVRILTDVFLRMVNIKKNIFDTSVIVHDEIIIYGHCINKNGLYYSNKCVNKQP